MEYKIIVSIKAQNEIENALDYYSLYSLNSPIHFAKELESSYKLLARNPFFRIRYNNIRALKIKKFPFSLFYTIAEEKGIVKILSCFHNKKNPNKRPTN